VNIGGLFKTPLIEMNDDGFSIFTEDCFISLYFDIDIGHWVKNRFIAVFPSIRMSAERVGYQKMGF